MIIFKGKSFRKNSKKVVAERGAKSLPTNLSGGY